MRIGDLARDACRLARRYAAGERKEREAHGERHPPQYAESDAPIMRFRLNHGTNGDSLASCPS